MIIPLISGKTGQQGVNYYLNIYTVKRMNIIPVNNVYFCT